MPPRPHAGRLLLCSQPLSLPATAAPPREVAAWYAWLEAMDGLGDPRVRVRLHPGERSPRYDLPAGLHHLRDEAPNTLLEDLAWSDVVISPYSSVLVEAVGASRVPISAGSTHIWGVYAANAFLEDPRVPSVNFRSSPDVEDLLRVAAETAPFVNELRDDYLANIGDAARQTADVIVALATARSPRPGAPPLTAAPAARRGRHADGDPTPGGPMTRRPPARARRPARTRATMSPGVEPPPRTASTRGGDHPEWTRVMLSCRDLARLTGRGGRRSSWSSATSS